MILIPAEAFNQILQESTLITSVTIVTWIFSKNRTMLMLKPDGSTLKTVFAGNVKRAGSRGGVEIGPLFRDEQGLHPFGAQFSSISGHLYRKW